MKKVLYLLVVLFLGLSYSVSAQSVTVTSPNGSEIWPACASRTISWTATGTSGYYNVDYSTNGGTTWASIATFLNATTLNWTVPNVQSTNCLIRVYDSYNNLIVDQSNAIFTINASVRVTAPNGGESWQVGNPASQNITWIASGTGTYVTIEYSIDAGSSWTAITTSAIASSGSYAWTIPNTPSTQCLVRVRDNNTPCMSDISDNLFTIVAPTPVITVTSPNTAVTWYVGYSNTIQWTTQYVTNPFVGIDYSIDGGTTWTVIISSTNNSGSYNWTVPNAPSSQCRVRVKDAANPTTVFDISNVNFTIAIPVWTITVTAPNGGETWNSCSTYNITWNNTFVTGNYKIEYSTDNSATWNTITNSTSGSSYSWQVPNNIATSSQCLIRVSSVTNPTVFDVSNANFTINQVQYVAVTAPNGGENWQVGNPATRNITWVFSGTGNYFNIEYSIDNGATWTSIVYNQYFSASPATYSWTLPNTPSNLCLVRVSDYSNTCRSDVSNNVFSIIAPTPVITVTNPNTATTWYVGSSYSINWTSQYVTNPFVGIDYSIDNGATWITIIATTNNNGSYSWTVPNTPSTQCLVRVKDAANPTTTFDVSNVTFTIATPVSSITVTSPNGGESWNSCSTYSITWSQSNVTGNYKIEYSANGGTTWTTIVANTSGTSYSWQVPNNIPTSSQCLIRVSSVNTPAVTDISNAPFTINQVQFVAVTSPNGGETWQVGNPTTRPITWAFSGTSNYFSIEYSIDNGITWTNIINNQYFSSSPASYTWTIPNAPSTQCLVRVYDYQNTCRSDVSNANFTIQAPTPVITVTNPNTATTWYIGSSYSINWTQQYVTDPFVAIEYSIDNGASWISIISAVNTTLGTYSWTVPNTPSTQCLVRVKSTANPATIFDESNVNFTIAPPVQTITVTSPNGGETWNSCVNYTISWNNTFVTGSYKLEFSTDNGTTWNFITNTSGSTYSWQVPNNIPTSNQCLIRVSSISSPAVFDVSNANFTINQVQYVVVTSPNGGETWQVGNPTTRTINWAFSGTSNYFSIEYSTDNGVSWTNIINNQYFSSSPASYTWTIPNAPSTQCQVRVYDYQNNCRSDINNTNFTIQAPTPVITVTNPNTATTWYVGSSYSINWTTQYVTDPFVSIDYSIDNGATWSNVLSSINTTVGTYNWTVPNTPSTQALMRVRSTANPTTIFDVSNVTFTIAPPVQTITVTSPNGGENFTSCVNYTISWNNTFVTGSYKLEYSTDNGTTWNFITNTSGSTYSWQVPNSITTSNQCLIRVSSISNPTVFDVSNANFTINQIQYVVVSSPNGGETWQVGNPTTRTINWAFSGTSNYFSIEYSTDNGASWTNIINNQYFSSSPASYTWTIPNVPSTQCLVRVYDYQNNCRSDVSNANFTIQAPTPVITVTNPNTATTWYIGSSYAINWSTQYVTDPFVAIDYSIDNGATWTSIVSGVNTTLGTYNWTVPNTPSTQALVRVKSTANPATIFDVSNVNFTIAPPVQTITVTSPNGGESFTSCVNYTISWNNTFVTGSYKLEYSSDNGATWNFITNTSGSSYSWQVPNNITTSNQCLIRVSSISSPAVFDVSNATFTITQVQYVAVTSPNGGETWQVGNPTTRPITWSFSGTSNYFSIEYSTDNGVTWTNIINNQYFSSSPASYTWTIPNLPSAQCLVRVYDYQNNCRSDVSNAVFTILAPTPVITVTSPNTGVLWGIGGVYAITWTQQYVTSPFVAIDYSTDGGSTWTNIVTAVNTTLGTYNWTVPNTPSTQCRVRVRDNTNPTIFDISNVNFSIVPAITITAPNGGENWGGCTVSSVTWTAYGTSGSFKIEYTLDNGANWVTVVSSYAAAGPNCTYSWTIPHASSSSCYVRVTDASASTKTDVSNNVFSMFPAIVLTNPTSNVAVFAGQTLNINWTSTGVSNYYTIEYSINGGSTWTNIVFNTLIMTNTYAWTVPATLSTNCLVRVSDYQNTCKQDVSDNAFTISPAASNVVVTAPNGNENWIACGSQALQWSAQGTSGTYNIEYSINGGSSWLPIATSYAAAGPNCSYTWTIPNNLSSNCLVRVTDAANGTRTDQSNAIFTISAFAIGATASSSSICTGAGTTLTANGAASYTWQPGNLSGANISVTPAATTTYTVTGTQGACSATTTVPVTVQSLPSVNASAAPATICSSGSVTLNATGASTYSWSPANSLNVSNVASPTATPTATTTYTVTGTSAAGCTNTSTVTVSVITAQSVTATASQTGICPGDNVTLTATGATSYTWMPGNLSGASVSVSPSSSITYTVTGTSGSCTGTGTVSVSVNAPPTVAASASQSTICAGTTITLSASGATTYNWMPGNLNGSSVSVSPTTTTTYTVVGSVGSCTDTRTVTVTVNAVPNVVISGSNTICSGSSTALSATGATTYNWMPGNLNTASVNLSPVATTTYTVVGTTGSCTDTRTITVTVNTTPTVAASGSTVLCTGSTTTLSASGAATYNWMPGNLNGASIAVSPTVTTTYTVTGTAVNGCSANANVTVTVGPPPTVGLSGNTTLCSGNSTTLSANGATSYSWQPGNLTGASVTVTPISTTTYTVTGTTGTCTDTRTITVTVNATPVVAATAAQGTICAGSSTTLTASGATNYTWQPGNLTTTTISVTPVATTTYTLTGTNGTCSGTQTVTVTVQNVPVVSVSGSSAVCAGSSTTLTATGATNYMWQPGNFPGSSVAVAPASNTTYTVTGTNGSCSGTQTFAVTVAPTPTVTASASQSTICTGGTITLTGGGAATYTWMPGNLTGTNVSVSPSASTTYTVTGVNGSCSSTSTVTVSVNTFVPVTVTGATPICSGNNASLNASGATSYTWQPGNLSGSSVTVSPSSTTTYTVTGTSGSCSGTQTVTLTVNTTPTVSATGGGAICSGNTASLNASGAGSYNWQPGNMSGAGIVVAPASATTYTVTGTNAGGCTATATVAVAINATPAVSATSSGAICTGGQATLTGSGAITYAWQPGNLTGNNLNVSPASTTTYTVTGTSVDGCTATSTVAVTVSAIPVVSTSSSTSVCAGSSATLAASGATTYNWMPGNLSGSSVSVTPVANTTYTVTGTSGACSGTQTVTVTVNALPTVAATGGGAICPGNTITLGASGATSYNWQPGNMSGASVVVAPASATTYTVSGTNASGCTNTATVAVAINTLPPVAASSSGPICAGGQATLTGSGAVTYAWQPGNLTGNTVNVSPASNTTYTVTGTSSNGCTATSTVAVTVSPIPVVNATGAATICAGSSTTLAASGATTYTWMPGSLSGNSVSVTPMATTSYTVTGSNPGGCSSVDTVVVTVTPAPPISATAAQPTICDGSSTTLTASGAATYSWMPGNFTGSSIFVAPNTTTTYTVTGTSSIGCVSTNTVTVSVSPVSPVTIAGNQALCAGSSTSLTASGAVSYNWMPGNLSGSTVFLTPASNTTYTVTGMNANGCQSTSTVTVAVAAQPLVIAGGNNNLCSGSSTTLSATGATNFVWQPGNLSGSSITVTPASTTAYVVTGTDPSGCSSNDTVLVTVAPAPVVNASTLQNSFCAGGSTTLSATGANSYIWQPGNLTGSTIAVTPASTTTYTVTGTSGNCSAMSQLTITVLPAPSVAITGSSTICAGSSATLNATGASTYAWQPSGSGASISVTPVATSTFAVTGTDANGCTGTATYTVTVAPFPTVNASASNPTICAGDAVTLNAAGADIYNWQPGNLGGASTSVTPATTTTYTVIGTNAAGCNDTTTVSITVNPLPTVTLALADDTVCTNDFPFALGGGAPSGGVYSGQGVVGGQFDPATAGVGLHQVMYTYTDVNTGCDNTATQLIYVDACTGIEEADAALFSVYPNPAHDLLTISYPNFSEPMRVNLYNSLGEVVGSWMMSSDRLDITLGTLPVGMYQLTFETPEGLVTKKIVKM